MKKIKLNLLVTSIVFLLGVGTYKVEASSSNTIDHHSTMEHTKLEVIENYIASASTYDYSNSIYEQEPITTSPYFEGVLKTEVKQDVLRHLNFYRWLAGLNPVGIQESGMQRSQKASLVQAVNGEMSHHPTQPDDMDDDFYKEAYLGAGSGSDGNLYFSGNVAWGYRIDEAIAGWIDDNCSYYDSIVVPGHRASMLDPYGISVSFGSVLGTKLEYGRYYEYTTASIYYDSAVYWDPPTTSDTFYSWPTAGYFPVESFPAYEKSVWSIWVGNNYTKSSDTTITLTYLGKDYIVNNDDIYYNSSYHILYYFLPSELNKVMIKSNQYIANTSVDVKVSNLNSSTDIVNLEYTTNFINAKMVDLNDINLCLQTSEDETCKNIDNGYEFDINKTYNSNLILSPIDATIDELTVEVSDKNILSYDNETKLFTPKKIGNTTIKITENYTGYTKTINVSVKVPATGIKLTKEKIYLIPNDIEKLIVNLLPENTTETATYSWTSSNNDIVSVDNTGTITAKKIGKATITVTSSNGFTTSCEVTVSDYLKGDMNKDGSITITDVIKLLRVYLELEPKENYTLNIGDMNEDGNITITDVIKLLRIYLDLE